MLSIHRCPCLQSILQEELYSKKLLSEDYLPLNSAITRTEMVSQWIGTIIPFCHILLTMVMFLVDESTLENITVIIGDQITFPMVHTLILHPQMTGEPYIM